MDEEKKEIKKFEDMSAEFLRRNGVMLPRGPKAVQAALESWKKQFKTGLKDSVAERPYHTNFSDQHSVKIIGFV